MKKTRRKNKFRIKKLISIILLVSIFMYAILKINFINQKIGKELDVNLTQKTFKYQENVQTYKTTNGNHTIYWAQGINPPKMTSDENLLGTEGYFDLEKLENYETYLAEFKPGNGYFDYNKNLDDRPDEQPLCYLGAASNLISWWLEQNKEYVNEYISRLKNTDIYGQDKNLYKILPFNSKLWEDMTKEPTIEIQQNYKAQKLGKSPLSKDLLRPYYYKKEKGYYVDKVVDFFINGYEAIEDENNSIPNTEENYKKDPRGGFFYPIFGKKIISERLTGSKYNSYDYINKNLRKMFAEGKGVSLGYEVGPIKGHAITVWGAEYDENNNLCRIFITDSDDCQAAKPDDEYWRGLVGFDVVPDLNGKMCITNNKKYNPVKPGNYINTIYTISLEKDFFNKRLLDTKKPLQPIINVEPKDRVVALNGNVEVKVDAIAEDSGYLEYEWYVHETENSEERKIPNQDKNTLKIDTTKLGTKYYYCLVKNIKNGKSSSIKTNSFKIDVQNIELTDAEKPNIRFNYNTVTFNQYEPPTKLFVSANVNDGGKLTYQWYQANDNYAENGRILKGEVNQEFYPPTNVESNGLYYYCEITNTNHNVTGNQVTKVKTPFSKKIIIKKSELLNATRPIILEQPKSIKIKQFDTNKELKIVAKNFDGGILTYQWYEVNGDNTIKILENEKNSILKIKTEIAENKRYKCEIKNTNNLAKNNKENIIYTDVVNVEITKNSQISSNNNLKELNVLNSIIEPKFNKNITNYVTKLEHGINKLEFNAIPEDIKSNIRIQNPIIEVGEVKEVIITVEAEDKSLKEYIIKVTRDTNHNMGEWQIEVEPSCIKEGKKVRKCSGCGYEEVNVISKKVHKYDDWKIIKEPTCILKGEVKRFCLICGNIERKEILETGHFWDNKWTIDKEATCKEEGEKSHHCIKCNEKKDITKIEKIPHQYGKWEIVKVSTNTEKGKKRRNCKNCKNEEIEYIDIKIDNQNVTKTNKNETNNDDLEKSEETKKTIIEEKEELKENKKDKENIIENIEVNANIKNENNNIPQFEEKFETIENSNDEIKNNKKFIIMLIVIIVFTIIIVSVIIITKKLKQ